jgi:cell division protein FtsW (lipid II flippase)
MTVITLAPVLLLLCVAVGVAVLNRARRDLTVEQKAALFDAAPKRQSWVLVAMAVVLAAFELPPLHTHSNRRWSLVAFSVVVFVIVLVPTVAHFRRVSQSGVPIAYVRAMRISMWILWVAAFLYFTTLTFYMWRLFPR